MCDSPIDASTAIDGKGDPPAAEDVSICLKCSSILFFNPDLSLRAATSAEIDVLLKEDPRLITYVQAATAVRNRK